MCTVAVYTTTKILADHLMSNFQPWLVGDIHSILSEPEIAAVREGNFVGVHVRRGDKVTQHNARKTASEARSTREHRYRH